MDFLKRNWICIVIIIVLVLIIVNLTGYSQEATTYPNLRGGVATSFVFNTDTLNEVVDVAGVSVLTLFSLDAAGRWYVGGAFDWLGNEGLSVASLGVPVYYYFGSGRDKFVGLQPSYSATKMGEDFILYLDVGAVIQNDFFLAAGIIFANDNGLRVRTGYAF
jgi:hypothetical protein